MQGKENPQLVFDQHLGVGGTHNLFTWQVGESLLAKQRDDGLCEFGFGEFHMSKPFISLFKQLP